ncbi:succinylglutamate desuccinylase/aspartoacylase family protein [Pelagibius litoralis]|uniref:Succinylglutamate desuccinylase/aspartoacylase family protein n=1 Tax=Pelagibius litoralis TaxID=374515 RepID=A0A967K6F1_9PROT|nr:succinylglutamate desuccinylase/aspartoacylase family protein [Pelagibius litoralis]NIA69208.1 succinylglutamate desuccinylase/aspartoacylase family protein [Pelagibius litoralis]
MTRRAAFQIGTYSVEAGQRQTVDLPLSVLSNHTPMALPVHVAHGARPGPTLFVSAVIHGDEIIGVEIIRRLLALPVMSKLRGTLLAIPIVNAFGFISHSRYLPDRRDLNRSFPGSAKGSLAGQLADLFLTEIVARADVGIDLHSAAVHRVNLPQIRISPEQKRMEELAIVFGAPVILEAPLREGSLRQAAVDVGTDVMLFEAGEGLRFDEFAVRVGVTGILRVMKQLGMVPARSVSDAKVAPTISQSSYWLRAPDGGVLRSFKTIGDSVAEGDLVGIISDPFGEMETEVRARDGGLLIGRTNLPVVNQGDGLMHIARHKRPGSLEATVGQMIEAEMQADPLFDEDEII